MFASCDDDHENVLPETDENVLPDSNLENSKELNFHLKVKQTSMSIFERMEFEFNPNEGHAYNELNSTYDSIEWHVDTKGKMNIFSHGYDDGVAWSHTTWTWSHNFFLPGKFNTFLIGYKDDNKFYSDTTVIDITNDRDFLAYRWSDIKGSIGQGMGYHTQLPNKQDFTTYQDKHDDVPCVTLNIADDNQIYEHFFLDFMKELYSDPDYTLEAEELLMEKYNELFHYKKEDASPTNIWITSNSRIALLKCYVERYDYTYYEVYAEPNK
ncbi:hypothetical protein DF185_05415 [Marinifilum breve]|uniref:Uncharacterized protein n=2 Tax=Marinifilum breve TaxID=2184082 RepID=A0A2V4ADI1_9BACT|nr:hypothetical protein DF185_05415 [Marinifilum breve]